VQLIDDQMEDVPWILSEPLHRSFKDRSLGATHQHDVQHRVVGDEDVRRVILHVPAAPHLPTLHAREEPGCRGSRNEVRIAISLP